MGKVLTNIGLIALILFLLNGILLAFKMARIEGSQRSGKPQQILIPFVLHSTIWLGFLYIAGKAKDAHNEIEGHPIKQRSRGRMGGRGSSGRAGPYGNRGVPGRGGPFRGRGSPGRGGPFGGRFGAPGRAGPGNPPPRPTAGVGNRSQTANNGYSRF